MLACFLLVQGALVRSPYSERADSRIWWDVERPFRTRKTESEASMCLAGIEASTTGGLGCAYSEWGKWVLGESADLHGRLLSVSLLSECQVETKLGPNR